MDNARILISFSPDLDIEANAKHEAFLRRFGGLCLLLCGKSL